jgi:aryl-alcohol dehydrogenase-like predicted oxidoreductase
MNIKDEETEASLVQSKSHPAHPSRLALGTAQFGYDYGINNARGRIPKEEVFQILHLALDSGVEVLDTAYGYQESETVIGSFIASLEAQDQSKLKIISKYHNKEIDKYFNESLVKLNSQSVYGYLIHHFDKFIQDPTIWSDLRKLRQNGKIQKIGLSLYYPEEAEYILRNSIDLDIIQFPFSILDQRFSYLLPTLKQRGIEIYVRSVFLQGLVFKEPNSLEGEFRGVRNQLLSLRNIASQLNIPLASLCINFALLHKHIDHVILGVDGIQNAKENIAALGQQSKVSEVFTQLKSLREDNPRILLPTYWN